MSGSRWLAIQCIWVRHQNVSWKHHLQAWLHCWESWMQLLCYWSNWTFPEILSGKDRFSVLASPTQVPGTPVSEPFIGFVREFNLLFRVLSFCPSLTIPVCQVTHHFLLWLSTFLYDLRLQMSSSFIKDWVCISYIFSDENGTAVSTLCHLKIRSIRGSLFVWKVLILVILICKWKIIWLIF